MANLHASIPTLPGDSRPLVRPFALGRFLVDGLIVLFFLITVYATTPIKEFLDLERVAWLAADGIVALLLIYRPGPFVAVFRQHLVMLSWPILAVVSFLWSIAPGPTLYYGLQFLMTVVVGICLCMYADLSRLLKLLFIALLMSAFLSLFYVAVRPAAAIWPSGDWMGVFPHKNVLGHMMALLIFTSLCLWLQGWQRPLTAFATVFALGLLFMSRSGVGMVALALALGTVPLVIAFRAGPAVLAFTVGLGAALVAGGVLGAEIARVDIMESALEALGKDSTLTGRTVLWEMGAEAFYTKWWIGFGFKGIWANPVTSEQLRYIFGQDIPYFHNNFVEVAVAFGVWGPILLTAGLLVAFSRAIKAYLADAQYVKAWPIVYLVFVLVLTYVENPLFSNHSIHQLLFVVAIGSLIGEHRAAGRDGD